MRIKKICVKNFRLLAEAELLLEDVTTVIVGRNNSGKTSLADVIRRFLDGNPRFQLEDFSNTSYDGFCAALRSKLEGASDNAVRLLIPYIEIRIHIEYDAKAPTFGPISEFIIDVDDACNEALIVARYELQDARINDLFDGHAISKLEGEERVSLFRTLRERIPALYKTSLWAVDPNDSTNRKSVGHGALGAVLSSSFVNAQRGLDGAGIKETDVLAKILEGLFTNAALSTADAEQRAIADRLKEAVANVQSGIDTGFKDQLKLLMPTLKGFGYPGLDGQVLTTETTLDVKRLLSNHTKVHYEGYSGVTLPEAYNGLGSRNLIFILLQLVGFYRSYRAEPNAPSVHLVFIEEPEAHLHPQMQEVFIRQLETIAKQFNEANKESPPWPVQFVVSTHSSHIANEAKFDAIRYFVTTKQGQPQGVRHTKIMDLRAGLQKTKPDDLAFLHQYMTLTRCDLFFADKAILIEGTSERILLPKFIGKMEAQMPEIPALSSQYISVMEVGGAYAHLFFPLLDFLELPYLVITDLDSVEKNASGKWEACAVHKGARTSNACIKEWFNDKAISPAVLLNKKPDEKVSGMSRIAYQHPEPGATACGRTFEDAFMLANAKIFNLNGTTAEDLETEARAAASEEKKSAFALKFAITEKNWTPPAYIVDGLRWLAKDSVPHAIINPVPDIVNMAAIAHENFATLKAVSQSSKVMAARDEPAAK